MPELMDNTRFHTILVVNGDTGEVVSRTLYGENGIIKDVKETKYEKIS